MATNVQIGDSRLLDLFLRNIELSAQSVDRVLLASPFVALSGGGEGGRIRGVLARVSGLGGDAKLVGELSQRVDAMNLWGSAPVVRSTRQMFVS